MTRRAFIVVASLTILAGSISASRFVPRDRDTDGGSYLYFDASNKPLNLGRDVIVNPLEPADSARATSRSFVSWGIGGTALSPGNGAMCGVQECWIHGAATGTSHGLPTHASVNKFPFPLGEALAQSEE